MSRAHLVCAALVLVGLGAARAHADEAPLPPAAFVPGEGFYIQSSDGNWRLRPGLQAAAKYEPRFPAGSGNDWSNFALPFVRLRLDGNLFRKWIRYWFSLELSNNPLYLLDGYVEVQPWSWLGIRGGQQFSPLSRHEVFGPQEILFPEWSIVANYFWPARDKGVTLFGITDYVEYYVAFDAGTPVRQVVSIPGNYVVQARVTVNPLGKMGATEMPYVVAKGPVPTRFSFTLQGYYGKINITRDTLNPSSGLIVTNATNAVEVNGQAGADFMLQADRFSFLAEFYYQHVDPQGLPTPSFHQLGFWAQANYVFYRRILSAALRFNWLEPSLDLANDNSFIGEAMLAWWIAAPHLSLRARYGVGYQQNPGPPPAADPKLYDVVRLGLPVGTSHLLTLQATLCF